MALKIKTLSPPFALLLLLSLGIGGYWVWTHAERKVSANVSKLFATADITFGCNPAQYETGCYLTAWDSSNTILKEFGFIEYDQNEPSVLSSPDHTKLLLVREREVSFIDTKSLEQKTLARAPEGQVFGTYTGFPSFIPNAKWLTNNKIQVSLFDENINEEKSPMAPVKVLTISVD